MFQLRHLKTFLAAAETLSFTKAAAQVHLSQPTVTEQVQALEHSLGQALFVRSNNRLALTAAGERLAVRARELLTLADDALRAIRDNVGESPGSIRVAAPQTLCACLLTPMLLQFAQRYPSAQVAIQERNSADTVQAVLDGTADVGLIHGWPASDAKLRASLIARDMPVVVMPAGHELAAAEAVAPDALAAFPLIATMPGCRYRQYLDVLVQQAPVRPRIRAEADSVPALMQMVSAGMGVAVLPRLAVDTAPLSARVETRPLSSAGEGLPICLLSPERTPAPHVSAFIKLLEAAVAYSDEPVSALDMEHRAGRIAVT
ncbi:LysR family transcriptional regulator [Achromobacter sp.]|uniref:LysR family transcriptional regulator n=1 Tax=Achromobacter sp. TaxID=134375 RepID=UPI0028A8EA25|nr:LysR family transcriptional regulator [Achromobacter sp.]